MFTTSLLNILLWTCFIQPVYCGAGHKWSYKGMLGPDHWSADYPDCAGEHQSPVDVKLDQVVVDETLGNFNLTHFSKSIGVSMILANIGGHTVEVIFGGNPIYISGGGMVGRYKLEQFHFHWGANDDRGSEHAIDGRHFPMEMHVVLYNTRYEDFSSAVFRPKGLQVLAFMFTIGRENRNMFKLLDHFSNIKFEDDSKIIDAFPLSSLLPKNLDSWYRYQGSLTTPPCSETVTWTIFKDTIEISEEQLDKFRQIMKTARRQDGKDSTFLVDDFRPLQILNNRKIYSNRPTKPHVMYTKNNSHRLVPVEFMIAVLVIFAALKAHY